MDTRIKKIIEEFSLYLPKTERASFIADFISKYKKGNDEVIISQFYILCLEDMKKVVTPVVQGLIDEALALLRSETDGLTITDEEWNDVAQKAWNMLPTFKIRNGVDMCAARGVARAMEFNSDNKKTKTMRFMPYDRNQSGGFVRNVTHTLAPSRSDNHQKKVNVLGIDPKIVFAWSRQTHAEEKVVAKNYSNKFIQLCHG